MLGVYIDERHASSITKNCNGGMRSLSRAIGQLERSWAALLAAHGIEYVHATEMRQAKLQFKDWIFARRLDFCGKALKLIQDYVEYFIAITLDNSEYNQYYRDHDGAGGKRRGVVYSKYGVCFRVFIRVLTEIVQQLTPGEAIAITLEAGHENSGAAQMIFAEYLRDTPEQARLIEDVAYVDKEKSYGAQAADSAGVCIFSRTKEEALSRITHHVLSQDVPTFTPERIRVINVQITPEMLSELRSGQISQAQQKKWVRNAERRLAG